MTTLDQALRRLQIQVDRVTVETYVEHAWVRPVPGVEGWQFEEVDIARIDLVTHLRRDMRVNDEAMEVVLSLLDQLYDLRNRLKGVHAVIGARPDWEGHPVNALLADLFDKTAG